jgi:ATP-dependent DNA helicase PIF1
MKKLRELVGTEYVYEAIDSVRLNEDLSWKDTDSPVLVDPIFHMFSGQNVLNLKVGAQVILLRNLDVKNMLANGSRGVVEGFVNRYDQLTERHTILPVVRFLSGKEYVVGYHDFETCLDTEGVTVHRRQLPLKLGWGMTIHRAQGMTLDRAIIDLPEAFVPGHAYVALSRLKSLDGLSLSRFSEKSLYVSSKVQEFHSRFLDRTQNSG